MAAKPFDFQDVLQLIELVKNSSTFSELRIRSGDLEIEVRRRPAVETSTSPAPSPAPPVATTPVATPITATPAAPAVRAEPPPRKRTSAERAGATIVTAPMVGTVYHAPEPGAQPFVKIGQQVAVGDRLCIIEVMKLMTAIRAERPGTVVEILVGDGEAVVFGQELFVIEAS